jgi:hypothetical protein
MGGPQRWNELPSGTTPIPSKSTERSSQHIESVRSRLLSVAEKHRDICGSAYSLKSAPFPLLRAYEAALEHSPGFSRVLAHLIAGGYSSSVLYVVAYAYEDSLFKDDARCTESIQEIIGIANLSDLANTLHILVTSDERQRMLKDQVRFGVRMRREYGAEPTRAMLDLVDELGYGEVCSVIDRLGLIDPSQIRAVSGGIPAALSSGAL